MKTLFTVLILCCSFSGSAQYHPFPTDSAIWVNNCERYDDFGPWGTPNWYTYYINNFCATGVDTVINAVDYKVIEFCNITPGQYFGAIRYDSGQVYFIPQDSLNENLLYDFTLNPGESTDVLILQPHPAGLANFYLTNVTVNDVETIIVNGTPRRVLDFSTYSWIEGIGCTSGLFSEVWGNISAYDIQLRCMSYRDTTHYDFVFPLEIGVPGSCPNTLDIDVVPALEVWNVSPNPANDFVQITSDSGEKREVIIYDALGRLALTGFHTEEEIPLNGLENGVYHAIVRNSQHPVQLKFAVTH